MSPSLNILCISSEKPYCLANGTNLSTTFNLLNIIPSKYTGGADYEQEFSMSTVNTIAALYSSRSSAPFIASRLNRLSSVREHVLAD